MEYIVGTLRRENAGNIIYMHIHAALRENAEVGQTVQAFKVAAWYA